MELAAVDDDFEAALARIKWWNQSCAEAGLAQGAKGKDIGKEATMKHILAHRNDVRKQMRCCRW